MEVLDNEEDDELLDAAKPWVEAYITDSAGNTLPLAGSASPGDQNPKSKNQKICFVIFCFF